MSKSYSGNEERNLESLELWHGVQFHTKASFHQYAVKKLEHTVFHNQKIQQQQLLPVSHVNSLFWTATSPDCLPSKIVGTWSPKVGFASPAARSSIDHEDIDHLARSISQRLKKCINVRGVANKMFHGKSKFIYCERQS